MKKLIDFRKLITRIWIILWLILAILLVMKFCFGIWYPIAVNNNNFIAICNFIDNNTTLKCLVGGMFYILNINIWYLSSTRQKKYSKGIYFAVINIMAISVFLLKFFVNTTIANFIELIYLIVLPIIYNIKNRTFYKKVFNILYPIIIYIIINLFQLNILLVRDINNILSEEMFLIGLIMQIDYYIFLIITYIGVCHMGWWSGGWFFGKTLTELKEIREKELAKSEPDKEFIAELDKAIKEKEEKEQ